MRLTSLALVTALFAAGCRQADGGGQAARQPLATKGHTHATADPHAGHGSAMAHGDHAAKHGGQFFMAPDGFTHLEGAWSEPGIFRLWLYDDHTRPIDAAPFRGRINLESDAAITTTLAFDPGTRTLVGRFETAPTLPVDLELWLQIPGRTASPDGDLFNFSFADYSREGAAPAGGAHDHSEAGPGHAAEDHSHGSPHGGQVVSTSGDQHLELAFHGQLVALYLLDGTEATLPVVGATASLLIQAPGQPPRTLALGAHGDHFMASEPLEKVASTVAVATVTTPTGVRVGRFAW